MLNNFNGLNSELVVARSAPGVVALNKKFSIPASDDSIGDCGSPKPDGAAQALEVEVDVVANGGHTWIEVSAPSVAPRMFRSSRIQTHSSGSGKCMFRTFG